MAGISCILALPQVVYTGDEVGRVVSSVLLVHVDCYIYSWLTVIIQYEWSCVQRR